MPTATGGAGKTTYTLDPVNGLYLKHTQGLQYNPYHRIVQGKPSRATNTVTYTYTARDKAGATTQIRFTITVFKVAVEVSGQALDDTHWSVMQHERAKVRVSISRPDDYQFRVGIPSTTGFQLNTEICMWPSVSPKSMLSSSTTALWSRWVRQNETFDLVRCGLGSKTPIEVKVLIKFGNNGASSPLYSKRMTIKHAWHQDDKSVTYYVRGTVGNEIRATSTGSLVGMFPEPLAGEAINTVVTQSLSMYDHAAAPWHNVNAGVSIKRASDKSSAEVLIRGYYAPGTDATCDPDTIACVVFWYVTSPYPHESDRQTMWIEDPPQWGNKTPKTWVKNFHRWQDNKQELQYLPATLTHEFGHPLGFSNVSDPLSVMSGSKKSCKATNLHCLSASDENALRAIYQHHHVHK